MTRLRETLVSTVTPFHQSPEPPSIFCQCLRKYTDVLCQLQNIERFQRPVEADTFHTCVNLVLNVTENQHHCDKCVYDSRVIMQLVMIFQTVFTWTESLCCSPTISDPNLSMTLGRHALTREECNFVRVLLMARALNRVSAVLKAMMMRITHVTTKRQGRECLGHEGADFQNLQHLINSLMQRYNMSIGRLGLKK